MLTNENAHPRRDRKVERDLVRTDCSVRIVRTDGRNSYFRNQCRVRIRSRIPSRK